MTHVISKTTTPVILLALIVVLAFMMLFPGQSHPPYQSEAREDGNNKYPDVLVEETSGNGIAGTIPMGENGDLTSFVESPDGKIRIDFSVKDVSSTTPFEKQIEGTVYLNSKEMPETTIDLALKEDKKIIGEEKGIPVTNGYFTQSLGKDWDGTISGMGYHLGT